MHRDSLLEAAAKDIPRFTNLLTLLTLTVHCYAMARTSYAVKRGHSKATLWALWSSVLFYSRFFKAEILDLGIGYLDDLTLGGNTETVAAKVQLIETESKNLGLHRNHSKDEMCHKNRMSIKAQTFQNCIKVTTNEMTLLGAPLH